MRVLVCYATRHGSTREIAEAVTAAVRRAGASAELCRARAVRGPLTAWDLVVLGAPLYSGRWHRDARRFVKRHRRDGVPLAVFASGPREDTPEAWRRSWAQLGRALGTLPDFTPASVGLFGGVDPAGRSPRRDVRDWTAVREWAGALPGVVPSTRR